MNIVLNRLQAIASAVMYAAEANEVEEVLQRIAHVTREITRTKYAALGVPDEGGGFKYFKFSGVENSEIQKIGKLPMGKGLLGAIMTARKPIRVERLQEDERSVGFPEHHPPMSHFLGVPIQIGQHLYGIFYLCDREDGKPFDQQDEILVEVMAGYAALAIAGAELSQQRSQLKLLAERQRIGMELHDGVIQSLYALGMHLDLLRTSNAIQPDDLMPVIQGLNHVIEDIRAYILKLRSHARDKTIHQCLTDMLGRLHLPDSIRVEIDAPDLHPPFAPAAFEGVCLMVNEAVSNAVRHAEATLITVHSYVEDKFFILKIRDNGRGFDTDLSSQSNGLGLQNMRQRALMYGGSINIDSSPGSGTTLTIRIPVGIY
jgi:signal transduction histidine kinase